MNINNGKFKHFDSSLYEILLEIDGRKKSDVLNDGLQELIESLIEEQWGFWTSEKDAFIPLKFEEFQTPETINNCIIDIDEHSPYDLASVLRELRSLGCLAYQIRYYHPIDIETIEHLKLLFHTLGAEYVQIIFKLKTPRKVEFLRNFDFHFFIYDFPDNFTYDFEEMKHVEISHSELIPHLDCGFVNQFSVNIRHFTESIHHNTCLFKKVGICTDGSIKNCPSDSTIYGKIHETPLSEIVSSSTFKRKWGITKKQITTCNVCEFRNICTDCRVFTENDDLYGKPAKCTYDPYSGKWIS